MFAAKKTGQVTIDDDGTAVVVTIQKLNWNALGRAAEIQSEKAMATAAKAGADLMKLWTDEGAKKKVSEDPEQRYRTYDRETVLLRGIKSWTSEAKLAEGISDLDEQAADALFRAIVDLSLPARTTEQAEQIRGEG